MDFKKSFTNAMASQQKQGIYTSQRAGTSNLLYHIINASLRLRERIKVSGSFADIEKTNVRVKNNRILTIFHLLQDLKEKKTGKLKDMNFRDF